MRIVKTLSTTIILASGCFSSIARSESPASVETIVLQSPVTVTATVKPDSTLANETEFGGLISVSDGRNVQQVHTGIHAGNLKEAQDKLRSEITWRPPYLFIHSSCGGGNAWACDSEVVFKVVKGTANRIGNLVVDPSSVVNGRFFDVYDKLEQRIPSLSHASSPGFTVVLDDSNDKLVANAEATWEKNEAYWHTRLDASMGKHPLQSWLPADWETYFSPIVGYAVLAKYCHKDSELQTLLRTIDSDLDSDHRAWLAQALDAVVPLESTSTWRK